MRSMTGFGAGDAGIAGAKLTIEIRAVNHRYLDLRVRVPTQLPDLVAIVESLGRERLTRGRFDVAVRFDSGALGAMVIDRERAKSVFAGLASLRDELAPGSELPLSLLGAVPDLFVPAIERDAEALNAAVVTAFDRARAALDAMRTREGAALADDLKRRVATVRTLAATVAANAPVSIASYRQRLAERAARLATAVSIDAGRLEQEVVLFADKIDVAEELTRLESHCGHLEAILGSPDAIGRRLDFLLQEMAREVNTIGSKSQDVAIAHAVVDLKTEVERMREQVQNVE